MALKPITSLKSLLSEVGTPDRLKLIERLGFGGQAEVWLARDKILERFVTVNKVRAFKTFEEGDEDERLNSLRARAEMEHPAIPTLFGVIPHGEQSWLVSEYVEGVALSELLGELSPESIYAIAKDLLSALRCLERLSLVHGDLSPNNIVIDRNGQVRLLDFESCSRIGELSSTSTIGFSAPERHARKVGLPSVDTWSVGAILIWLVTQRTPEIVFDDAKRPISVTIGPAMPATDVLGDVINIAAAATRLDPSLRPLTTDLEERLSLSYRWLDPVNRSALEMLVRSRSPSSSELDGGPSSYSGSAIPLNENLKSKLSAKSNLQPNNLVPWRRAQGWIKRARREEGHSAHNGASWTGLASDSIGWFSVKRLNGEGTLSTTFRRQFLLSLGLAIVVGLLVSVIDWDQQPYGVRIDTTRLSPATALPNEFSSQWVASIFSTAMPDKWERVSDADVFPKALPASEQKESERVDAELLDRGQSGDLEEGHQSLAIEASSNTQTHIADDALIEVIISINCEQGICELLAEHTEKGSTLLNHTVILDTEMRGFGGQRLRRWLNRLQLTEQCLKFGVISLTDPEPADNRVHFCAASCHHITEHR